MNHASGNHFLKKRKSVISGDHFKGLQQGDTQQGSSSGQLFFVLFFTFCVIFFLLAFSIIVAISDLVHDVGLYMAYFNF